MSAEEDSPTLADRLILARTERGLTQAQVAVQLGVRRQLYDQWEAGARPINRHAALLADYLGMTPAAVQEAARREPSAQRIAQLENEVVRLRRRVRELEAQLEGRPIVRMRRQPNGAPDGPPGQWLGIPEAAEVLGMAESTVRQMVKAGTLPAHGTPRAVWFDRQDLESWMASKRVKPGSLAGLYPATRPSSEGG